MNKKDEVLTKVLQKLGPKYEYIKFIGQGSFSKVYLLHHNILGQNHALKIMDSNYILQTLEKANARDIPQKFEMTKRRFLNEAKSYSKIDHPNVVRIYDVDVIKDENEGLDIIYILMQFVAGRNLKNILNENSPLEMDRVFAISKDILHAIARIHEAGIVHRDIKPANIIIEKETNRPVLIDFGLAKDIKDLSESTAVSEADRSLGTPVYMPPDQFQIHGKIGPAVDLYAFGILLYEMLTGDVPFKGTLAEIIKGHLLAPVPDIREKNPLAPVGFREIIKKALAKEPENRYQQAGDMLGDLEKIERNLAVEKGEKPKEEDKLTAEKAGVPKRKKRKYPIYLPMTLAILIAAAAFLFINPFGIGKKGINDNDRYLTHIASVRQFIEAGDLDTAGSLLEKVREIKNTAEIDDLSQQIAIARMKKDFEALETFVKGDAPADEKIEKCLEFIDNHKTVPEDEEKKSIISQVNEYINDCEGQIAGQYDKHITDAEEFLKNGEFKNAFDSVKMAKSLGEMVKTADLEDKIFISCVSAAEAYCKEVKPMEAEDHYLLAKAIKPDSNLRDLGRRIEFLKAMPEDVIALYKQGKKMEQNNKKYWETGFGDGIVMVYIPAARDNAGYWLGKTEVSVAPYMKFVNETHSNEPEWLEKGSDLNVETGTDDYYRNQVDNDLPVVGISWDNAVAYCQWLSRKTGLSFKLPSEAQWEKAARGTDSRLYPWGFDKPGNNLANFFSPSRKTVKVYANPQGASPYGLLNMAGNVEEWCDNQVARGGSFYSNERYIQCTSRSQYNRTERNHALGFRLCLVNK